MKGKLFVFIILVGFMFACKNPFWNIKDENETYSVTYDGNENNSGMAPTDELSYIANTTMTVLGEGNLDKLDHVFAGWNTKADGTGETLFEGDTFKITEDITLYAQWTPVFGIKLSETALSFAAVSYGYEPTTPLEVTVTSNNASVGTGFLTIALSGANHDKFTLSDESITNISAGEDETFSIVPVNGLTAGDYTAVVTISGEGGLTASMNVGFKVNKADPIVNWPTDITATYGMMLSNITLSDNSLSNPSGAFSWVSSNISVGSIGPQTHSMNFTPTDQVNYNTLTHDVIIHVSNYEMVWICDGSFELGRNLGTDGGSDYTPVSTVSISGFWMGRYQVTQELYQAIMGNNPSYIDGGSTPVGETQVRRPVDSVSWYDTIVFCNRLSMAEGLSPAYRINGSTNPNDWGAVPTTWNDPSRAIWDTVQIVEGSNGYRLPTEAQWEYAAKGGSLSQGYTYSGSNNPNLVAWYYGKTGTPTADRTHQVGLLEANELGIYDMSGNVWEWCLDWWGSYTSGAKTDPTGASSGSYRVIRGGSWDISAEYVRSVHRDYFSPSDRYYAIGFRVSRP